MSLQGHYRHITLRHERHLLRGTSPALAPGEARFSSYYLPSLPAGEYSLAIDQTITNPKNGASKNAEPAKRKIEVLAPEWALSAASNGDSETTNASDEEAAVVLSVFPASGQVAPSFRTLPHMVLRDAQLPWVRNVSEQATGEHSKIPWFALVVFSADELELDEAEGESYFAGVDARINDTLGWDLTVDRINEIKADALTNLIPDPLEPDIQAKTKTSLIPVKADVFLKLFPPKPKESTFDVSPYRFMSHIRTVATEGTLSAGIVADNDHDPKLAGIQTLSVIVSHRLGPTDVLVPTPVLAHLVSLQGIDGTNIGTIAGKKHVLMTSLFSWTYTALPPGAPDVVSMLRYLGSEGKGLSVLRTDMTSDYETKPKDAPTKPTIEEIITKRQNDGYNIVRHRVITGEQTVAMHRGPLTPTKVPHPLNNNVSFQSNFGTDLQILDPSLGLMDISYASAWQLGKTLAMADPAFTAALSRLRMLVHRQALEMQRQDLVKTLRAPVLSSEAGASPVKTRLSVFSDQNPYVSYMPKREIKSDMTDIVKALNGINETVHERGTSFSTNRWKRRDPLPPSHFDGAVQGQGDFMSLLSEHIYPQMPEVARFHMFECADTPDKKGPYNYHTIPNNTDYAVIQEWVLNKLHLSGIPAHYYLPDPTYVPEETLRFFHIDFNWMDALIDGALSLANHLASSPETDYCRSALKDTLNRYFKTPTKDDYFQQNPAYGFILRSKLLVQFPDLAVSAEFSKEGVHSNEDWDKIKPRAPILVQRRLGPDMMLVLMDREPPNLSGITFTLPAHQQTFVSAFGLTKEKVTLQCKRIYATGADAPLPEPDQEARRKLLATLDLPTSDLIDWDARTLKIEDYAKFTHDKLVEMMPESYKAPAPTSAVFSLQLNEPIYRLSVTAEKPKGKANQEDLDSWLMLHEPRKFKFYPPAFPKDKYLPKGLLSNSSALSKRPSFTATRLKITEPPFFNSKPTSNAIANTVDDDFTIIGRPLELHHNITSRPIPTDPVYPTDQPIFKFGVFPIGRKDDGYIPCNNDRPTDLVFSIVRHENTRPEVWPMRIMQWNLEIKIGDPDVKSKIPVDDYTKPRPFLRDDMPAGPPPVMLSNLRYNVLIQKWDVKAGLLFISIVPRSKWGVHMRNTPDASFLLPMVNVYPWKIPDGKYYTVKVTLKSTMINENNRSEVKITYDHTQEFKLKAL